MKTHRLKTLDWSYKAIQRGDKTFEIRKNDRKFKSGDIVELVKLQKESKIIDEEAPILRFKITYITEFHQKDGWCVFGIREI
jgi:uncharacterized protein YqfB (UPF0267 family)